MIALLQTGPLGVGPAWVEYLVILGLVLAVVGVPALLALRQRADQRKRER